MLPSFLMKTMTSGRRVGRQALTMAAQISIWDHEVGRTRESRGRLVGIS